MNRITRRVLIALCASVLAACGSSPQLSTTRAEGFVATTITSEGGRAWYAIMVENIDTKLTYRFGVGEASVFNAYVARHDEDLKAEGRPFVSALPIGRYVITGWSMESGLGRANHLFVNAPLFNVEAGKTTYLGNVHFSKIDWGAWRYKAEVTFSDRAARDLPVLRKRFENMARTPLYETIAPGTNRVMETADDASGSPVARIYVPATP